VIIFLDTKDESVAGILDFLEFILEFKGGILSDNVEIIYTTSTLVTATSYT
jgi:hypothetical protein